MSGQDLYALYAKYHAERNCSVDEWDDLDEHEQGVWNDMADEVRRMCS